MQGQTQDFQIVTQKARRSEQHVAPILVTNSFTALEMMDNQVLVGTTPCVQGTGADDRRGGLS